MLDSIASLPFSTDAALLVCSVPFIFVAHCCAHKAASTRLACNGRDALVVCNRCLQPGSTGDDIAIDVNTALAHDTGAG